MRLDCEFSEVSQNLHPGWAETSFNRFLILSIAAKLSRIVADGLSPATRTASLLSLFTCTSSTIRLISSNSFWIAVPNDRPCGMCFSATLASVLAASRHSFIGKSSAACRKLASASSYWPLSLWASPRLNQSMPSSWPCTRKRSAKTSLTEILVFDARLFASSASRNTLDHSANGRPLWSSTSRLTPARSHARVINLR